MAINYNSAKWYFCSQWSRYSGYRHPNHGLKKIKVFYIIVIIIINANNDRFAVLYNR